LVKGAGRRTEESSDLSFVRPNAFRLVVLSGIVALFAALLVGASAPSLAHAQGQPAICEDYPDLPVCDDADDDDDDDNDGDRDDDGGPSAGGGGGSGDADGSLPFTGYPITDLLLLLAVLLAAGFAIRAYLGIRARTSGSPNAL
jgi:hypothetical protein